MRTHNLRCAGAMVGMVMNGCLSPPSPTELPPHPQIASWPADGSSAVPRNLSMAMLTADPGHASAVILQRVGTDVTAPGDVGHAQPTCPSTSPAQRCFQWMFDRPLQAAARYQFWIPEEDAVISTFSTTERLDMDAPELLAPPCQIDEQETQVGCLLRQRSRTRLRVWADEPVRVRWLGSLEDSHEIWGPRGQATVQLKAAGWESRQAVLQTVDLAGNLSHHAVSIPPNSPGPQLSLHEIQSNPRGAEPDQEFIELFNAGDEPTALSGIFLGDAADQLGTELPPFELPGKSYVLLVADSFDPSSDKDVPIPAGTPLLRMGKSLTRSGLRNGGETLYLRTAAGVRLSHVPALPSLTQGGCIARFADAHNEAEEADAFLVTSPSGCTPGRPNPTRRDR